MQLPIIQPISFVLEALNLLDIKINKSQIKNLAMIVIAMIISGSLCLSKIVSLILP